MYYSTPLQKSPFFPQEVLLKLENTQPSGSFKSRGISNLIETEARGKKNPHVFACSGGNAGLAAAEAAAGLQIPCTVIVPTITKPRIVDRLRKLGAQVILHGELVAQADDLMQELMAQAKLDGDYPIYCHPFDNELIWEGHSTMIDEVVEQIRAFNVKNDRPSAIVLSCGGGGLYLGVMKGLERHGWAESVPVYVVETEGAPTFHESLKAGKSVVISNIKTIASSLASVYVPETMVEYAKKYNSKSVLVSDDDTVLAAKKYANDHCTIVEPACAATLAGIYNSHLAEVRNNGPVLAIVCGGSSFGPEDIQ